MVKCKIIIDTNLWISFLIGKQLIALKSLCENNELLIYVCKELLSEFEDVTSRQKIRKYITNQDISDTLMLIDKFCIYETVNKSTVSKTLRDEKDLFLLSLADTVLADYIVTGDRDLLILQNHNQTRIVTFSEFNTIL